MNPFDPAPLVLYILLLSLTPGPSALLIAAAGARFGLRHCTPHLAGALLGWELQLTAAVLGTGAAVMADPLLQTALRLASTAYLLWLGWRMLGARTGANAAPAAPLAWPAAVTLQLSNPKSWMTATASAGLFLPSTATLPTQGGFLLAAGGAGVTGLAAWAIGGAALQRWFCSPANQATLNRVMSAALALAALWGLRGAWGA